MLNILIKHCLIWMKKLICLKMFMIDIPLNLLINSLLNSNNKIPNLNIVMQMIMNKRFKKLMKRKNKNKYKLMKINKKLKKNFM